MRTTLTPLLLTAASLTTLLVIGCDGKDDVEDDTAATETTDPTGDDTETTGADDTETTGGDDTETTGGDYSLTITAPASGDTVSGDITMTYTVDGLTLDPDAMGSAHVPGSGHVHIYLDDTYVEATGDLSYVFSGLSDGAHTLGAVLAQNDHVEYPDTYQTVDITVDVAGTPLVVITSPDFGSETVGSSVELGLLFTDFTVVDNAGGTAAEGEGHYHIYVDGTYFGFDTNPKSTIVTDLAPGDHDISIVLANNDHAELAPQIDDTISIVVPVDGPSIDIITPGVGDLIGTASVPLSVAIGGDFRLSNDIGGVNVDGQGHYHVYIDGTYTDVFAEPDVFLLHTAGGEHEFMVALAENDHTEIGVVDFVTAEVAADRPDITIVSPPEGEIVTGDFVVGVSAENFTLDPDGLGTDPVDGEGHYHVLVDGLYNTASGESSATLFGVPPGEHTVRVQLAENNHEDYEPLVFDEVTVTVSGD